MHELKMEVGDGDAEIFSWLKTHRNVHVKSINYDISEGITTIIFERIRSVFGE